MFVRVDKEGGCAERQITFYNQANEDLGFLLSVSPSVFLYPLHLSFYPNITHLIPISHPLSYHITTPHPHSHPFALQ